MDEAAAEQGSGNGGEVVRFDKLTRTFGDFTAVDSLTLAVGEGEFFGFLGPNGAGKSTTIKMAAGLLKPTSGTIRIFGLDPYRHPMEVKAHIGLVPEELALYERLTGFESLVFSGRLYGLDAATARRRAVDLLGWLGLEEDGGKLVVDYSTGMKKKTALGCALIHRPRLLFLDEPFSGVDPLAVRGIKEVLHQMTREGTTIFFSSHVMELVERVCTRVAILHKGSVKAVGTLAEMRSAFGLDASATLEDIFVRAVGEPMAEESAPWLTA